MMKVDEYFAFAKVIEDNEEYSQYKIECQDSFGYMTLFEILPGVQIIFNDFHCEVSPEANAFTNNHYLEINHCLHGRFECIFEENRYGYLGEGDVSMNDCSIDRKVSSFPLGYYYGIEILIDIDQVAQNSFFHQFHIDVLSLFQRVQKNNKLIIVRSTERIQHIYWEMYHAWDQINKDYLKLKVAELLFFLQDASFELFEDRYYYTQQQIQSVKQIKAYLSQNYQEKYKIQDLADRFHINIATLRKCFKDIYGKPIYQWHKEYRLEKAKNLLLETDLSIITIASQIGYTNPSKFSAAFQSYFHQTPLIYRKEHKI